MKARRLPQKRLVLEVSENFQELVWAKIAAGVKVKVGWALPTLRLL